MSNTDRHTRMIAPEIHVNIPIPPVSEYSDPWRLTSEVAPSHLR